MSLPSKAGRGDRRGENFSVWDPRPIFISDLQISRISFLFCSFVRCAAFTSVRATDRIRSLTFVCRGAIILRAVFSIPQCIIAAQIDVLLRQRENEEKRDRAKN